jgi:hypothetical protein
MMEALRLTTTKGVMLMANSRTVLLEKLPSRVSLGFSHFVSAYLVQNVALTDCLLQFEKIHEGGIDLISSRSKGVYKILLVDIIPDLIVVRSEIDSFGIIFGVNDRDREVWRYWHIDFSLSNPTTVRFSGGFFGGEGESELSISDISVTVRDQDAGHAIADALRDLARSCSG